MPNSCLTGHNSQTWFQFHSGGRRRTARWRRRKLRSVGSGKPKRMKNSQSIRARIASRYPALALPRKVACILAPLDPWMLRRTYGTGWLSDRRPSEVIERGYNEPSAGCDLERGGVQAGSILGGLFRNTSLMNTPKPLGLWTPSLRQVAKKCRLRRSAARKTAWDVWEVNAGWVAWLDGTAVLMTRVTEFFSI